jgi:hypothetical protein
VVKARRRRWRCSRRRWQRRRKRGGTGTGTGDGSAGSGGLHMLIRLPFPAARMRLAREGMNGVQLAFRAFLASLLTSQHSDENFSLPDLHTKMQAPGLLLRSLVPWRFVARVAENMHQANRERSLLKTSANLARQRAEIKRLREAVEAVEESIRSEQVRVRKRASLARFTARDFGSSR